MTTFSVKMAGLLPELETGNFRIKSKDAKWTTVTFDFTVKKVNATDTAPRIYNTV